MFILKLLEKLMAIPVLIIVGIGWVIVKGMTWILNVAHGFFWLLLGILAILAVSSQMWVQLAQIIVWGAFSFVILTVGATIDALFELSTLRLVAFVSRG